jgi:hypothetical protein
MSKSAGASVNKQTENSQTGVDPTTMAWMKQMWDAAQGAGAAGPSSLTTDAAGYNSGLMGAGQKGLAALSGDAGAAAGLMNPYQSQVVDAANQQWDRTNQQTTLNANDAATRAGAFGGARHGIMEGTAIGQNNMNRNSQIGGLLSSGYDQTMNRAGTLAGMGFAGAGANANLGMGGVGSPQQWLLQMLKQGFAGPTGTTSSGAKTTAGADTRIGFGFGK